MAGATSVRKLSDAQLLDFERFLDAAPKYYIWGVGCLMSSIRGEQVAHNAEGLVTCKASLMGMAMRHEIKPGMNGSEFQAQFTEKLDEINQVLQDWQRRYPSASRAAATIAMWMMNDHYGSSQMRDTHCQVHWMTGICTISDKHIEVLQLSIWYESQAREGSLPPICVSIATDKLDTVELLFNVDMVQEGEQIWNSFMPRGFLRSKKSTRANVRFERDFYEESHQGQVKKRFFLRFEDARRLMQR